MLLETQDIRRNDILVYSQNKFDFENNFKIIFKHERVKKARSLSYFDVCEIIKEPVPKNLILYRLLTNVSDMDAYSTKYGYFLRINGGMELTYLDPVFALKDLRHLRFELDPENFRFKIQQIGLRTDRIFEKEAEFAEVYTLDLKADEAQNQNDKIFADAIFAFDDTYSSNLNEEDEFDKRVKDLIKAKAAESSDYKISIEAAKDDKVRISKPNLRNDSNTFDLREKKIGLLKNSVGISNETKSDSFNSFLEKNIPHEIEKPKEQNNELLDMFKSTNKGKDFDFGRDSVILKLSKE